MNISGKTFVVTGGASGLGRASAEAIIAAGGNAVILDVNDETGKAAEQALGGKARFAQADVTSEDQVKAAVDLAVSAFGGLHGAVNAAGIGPAAKVLGKNGPHALDLFEKTIRVNLVGTFNVIRLAAAVISQNQPLESGERGVIVNTASIAAFDGQIGQPAYAASKGGIVGMTLPIARDLASFGIRVNTIVPGLINTPLFSTVKPEIYAALEQTVLYPKRLGKPEEIAHLALYLCSAEAEFVTGSVVTIDGGWTAA